MERKLGRDEIAMPVGKFGVVHCDAPWRFEPYDHDTGGARASDNHYPTMQVDRIKAMTIPAADNAALFLWATTPMLPQALEVMTAWGFGYRSHHCLGQAACWHRLLGALD